MEIERRFEGRPTQLIFRHNELSVATIDANYDSRHHVDRGYINILKPRHMQAHLSRERTEFGGTA